MGGKCTQFVVFHNISTFVADRQNQKLFANEAVFVGYQKSKTTENQNQTFNV